MKRHLAVLITLVVAAACLSGCAVSPGAVSSPYQPTPIASPSDADTSRGTATPSPSPGGEGSAAIPTCTPLDEEEAKTTRPGGATPEASSANEAERLVQLAKEDLARRLDLSVSEVSLISVEAVDWPDTSLGCPQPGMAYAQVVTPGYLIVLEAEGQRYAYQTNRGDRVVLCHTDGDSQPPSPKGITDNTPWKPIEPIEPDAISPTPRP
jgi:hypothetical protein